MAFITRVTVSTYEPDIRGSAYYVMSEYVTPLVGHDYGRFVDDIKYRSADMANDILIHQQKHNLVIEPKAGEDEGA